MWVMIVRYLMDCMSFVQGTLELQWIVQQCSIMAKWVKTLIKVI